MPNYIEHFRSALSSFWSFIFHQQLYNNSPTSYCSYPHLTDNIYEFCGIIGNKSNACIIHGPNFLPKILRRKVNQLNALCGDEPTDPTREWNIQHHTDLLKSGTSPSKTSTVISDIMVRLNHHTIDNGDVEVQP